MKKAWVLLLGLSSALAHAGTEQLESAIREAESRISEARSYISSAEIDRAAYTREAGSLKIEAGRLQGEAGRFESEYHENTRLNALAITEGQGLAQELTGLLRDIAEQDYKIGNLKNVESILQSILSDSTAVEHSYGELSSEYKAFHDLQIEWLNETNAYIETKRPDFDSIVNKKAYVDAYLGVLNSVERFPNSGAILNKENVLATLISNLVQRIEGQQRKIRESASRIDFATYFKLSNKDNMPSFVKLDETNQEFIGKLNQMSATLHAVPDRA